MMMMMVMIGCWSTSPLLLLLLSTSCPLLTGFTSFRNIATLSKTVLTTLMVWDRTLSSKQMMVMILYLMKLKPVGLQHPRNLSVWLSHLRRDPLPLPFWNMIKIHHNHHHHHHHHHHLRTARSPITITITIAARSNPSHQYFYNYHF